MSKSLFKSAPMSPRLAESGFSDDAKQALVALDAALFMWHRMLHKGELTGRLLAASGIDLEPAFFQGLMAIVRITHGVGRDGPAEPTVGLVADEMAIDPSRASRITSELIARGYIERAVAQDDGRKTVLLLTGKGRDAFTLLRDRKWERLISIFADWSEQDIADFSRLFGRYAEAIMGDARRDCGEERGVARRAGPPE